MEVGNMKQVENLETGKNLITVRIQNESDMELVARMIRNIFNRNADSGGNRDFRFNVIGDPGGLLRLLRSFDEFDVKIEEVSYIKNKQ